MNQEGLHFLDTMLQTYSIEENGLQYAIQAAKKEISVSETFPLTFLPNLKEACEIDLILTEKLLLIVSKQKECIEEYIKGHRNINEIQSKLIELAQKKSHVYQLKEKASSRLKNLAKLRDVKNDYKSIVLGKYKKSNHKKSNHKKSKYGAC
jgi:hypothetical protein